MKLKKLFIGTVFLLGVTTASAEDVSPYYFDLIGLKESTEIASNYINNEIKELGGISRVGEAAKAGHDKASMIMGYLYLEGHVYKKNVDLGVEYLSRAASKGGYSAFLLGKHFLDLTGEFGYSESVKRQGASLVESAALSEIAEAEYLAGMLFINGEFLPEDRDLGMMHIKSASYKGHSPSRKFLNGIEKLYYQSQLDFGKIQKMATEGNVEAIIELGLMYKEGWKVVRDEAKAKRLLEVASSRGSEKAAQLLKQL